MNTTHSKHFNRWLYLAVILFVLSLFPLLAFGQTVTSVVPKSVQLEAGGKEVAITINGTGLDKVTSVQVVMNNQPVKEVLAVLQAPTLKGRQVILKASPQAMIGTNYQLRLMIGTTPVNLPTQIVQVEVVKATAAVAQQIVTTKMIKHEPRKIQQAEVDRHSQLVTTKKLAAIPHKAFTYQDFKDPKTGAPINKDTVITLKFQTPGSLKNGTTIKGQDFLNMLNDLEKKSNALGYTHRNPRKVTISAQGAKPTTFQQETVIKTKLMQDQRAKAAPAYKKLDAKTMKVKPYDKSAFLKAAALPQAVPQAKPAAVTPQSLQQIASVIEKPWNYTKNFDQEWGDRDWFAVGIHAKMILDADQSQMKAAAEGRATGTIFNQDWDIVKISGLAEVPSTGKMHAKFVANVCGDTFVNYEDTKEAKDGFPLIGKDQSIGVDESVSFHFVIVVIPAEVKLGFRGSAGVFYGFDLVPLKAKVLFAPYVETTAYAQVAIDLGVVEGGVGGQLRLLKAALPIGATVGVETAEPTPCAFAEYYIQNTVEALSGSIYVFAEVNLLFWSDYWSWDLFKWEGFKDDGYVVEPVRVNLSKCPPTFQLIVTKQGNGTVTSSLPGINCGFDCNESYSEGKTLILTAAPASDSYFVGWSGGGCSGTGPCTVTMKAATTVTAIFDRKDAYNVQLFEKGNLTGGSYTYTLVPGKCQVLAPDFTKTGWNDKVSSVKVGSKVGVVLFNSIQYSGNQISLLQDTPQMPKGWDNKASSLIVYLKENGAPIGTMLRGKHWQFLPINEACTSITGYPNLYHNDDATHVSVPPYLNVRVYQNANYGGKYETFAGPGEFDIKGKDVKGKVSSVSIELTKEMPKRQSGQ